MGQLTDEQLREPLDPGGNSVAVIVKHMAGNMASRWTDSLTTDGEKSGRDRDGEFVDTFGSRAEMLACWDAGWACPFRTLGTLTDADLARTVPFPGGFGARNTRSPGRSCGRLTTTATTWGRSS